MWVPDTYPITCHYTLIYSPVDTRTWAQWLRQWIMKHKKRFAISILPSHWAGDQFAIAPPVPPRTRHYPLPAYSHTGHHHLLFWYICNFSPQSPSYAGGYHYRHGSLTTVDRSLHMEFLPLPPSDLWVSLSSSDLHRHMHIHLCKP